MSRSFNSRRGTRRSQPGKEYWSWRGPTPMETPGKQAKRQTHKFERRFHCYLCHIEIPPYKGRTCDRCE